MLCAPNGTNISHTFKLQFLWVNSEAEYETLIIGLISALLMVIRKLKGVGDSKFKIKQDNQESFLKKNALVPY